MIAPGGFTCYKAAICILCVSKLSCIFVSLQVAKLEQEQPEEPQGLEADPELVGAPMCLM